MTWPAREGITMTDLQELLDIERAGWEALRTGQAGSYYRAHLTDDALMAFPFGVLTRDQTIEAMESAPPWTTYDLKDPQVVALTTDCGIVVYRVTARRAQDDPYQAVVSSTFVRRDGGWRMAFHQQTPA